MSENRLRISDNTEPLPGSGLGQPEHWRSDLGLRMAEFMGVSDQLPLHFYGRLLFAGKAPDIAPG
jgi:hypothetical protein